jgi:hypothetical protein
VADIDGATVGVVELESAVDKKKKTTRRYRDSKLTRLGA